MSNTNVVSANVASIKGKAINAKERAMQEVRDNPRKGTIGALSIICLVLLVVCVVKKYTLLAVLLIGGYLTVMATLIFGLDTYVKADRTFSGIIGAFMSVSNHIIGWLYHMVVGRRQPKTLAGEPVAAHDTIGVPDQYTE